MLRDYQKDCVNAMIWALDKGGNNVITLPTGAGKTHVISGFVEATEMPILILVPSKELLEQNYEKLMAVADESEIGIYSASMNTKEVGKYTLATIGSVYRKPEEFKHYKVVMIDECHLVDVGKKSTMYMKFLNKIGNPIVFGLTATPYRQDTFMEFPGGWKKYNKRNPRHKMLIETVTTTKMIARYKGRFWTRMLYVMNTHELIPEYLSELEYEDCSLLTHEEIPTNSSQSDFDLSEFEKLWLTKEQVFIRKISELSEKHKSILVFCTSIAQAKRLSGVISSSNYLESGMNKKKRERVVNAFKEKGGVLFNVGILTTGFDYPQLEAVALIRPTRSLNLYNQMLGRVTRKAPGKERGYIYDFAGTVKSLGRLETIGVSKDSGSWDVVSEARPDGFHLKELYRYKIKKRKEDDES